MNILIIGNGGREHAIAWRIRQSPNASRVFVAPGNGGTALEPGIENVNIAATDVEQLLIFAKQQQIDLTIVGPEAPLAAGLVDAFFQNNFLCFGPFQAAAQLETSKAFSKDFMARHNIPTAKYATFTDLAAAQNYLQQQTFPIVIKADGLAAGKGVVIAQNLSEALATTEDMLTGDTLGSAGHRVVIEEFLVGEEASFIVISDGEYALPLATSQDHKARDDGDLGPNTGGMGAYSPAAVVTPEIETKIMEQVIYPTIYGMAEEGHPYLGFLYAGIMITADNEIKVLEFNCRLGDPETQPILLRLKSDLLEILLATLKHQLRNIHIEWDAQTALGVVLASKGYPASYPQNEIISGLPTEEIINSKVFHAGTKLENNVINTAGGRVLCVTSLGETVLKAQQKAYELAKNIQWDNQYYRTDIGHKAITRESDLQDAKS